MPSTIEDFWKWLDSLENDVRKAVLLVSDDTGRPIAEEWVGVVELLKVSNTHLIFHKNYCAFRNVDEMDETAIRNSRAYFMIYLSGIKRLGEKISDDQ